MRTHRVTIAAAGLASLTGLTVAAANTVGRPTATVSHRSDESRPRSTLDDRGRHGAEATTPSTSPSTVTTLDDRGVDDPTTHDVGDDHGGVTPAAVAPGTTVVGSTDADDVGDDHGVDNPATHEVGDDHGLTRGTGDRSVSPNRGPGNSGSTTGTSTSGRSSQDSGGGGGEDHGRRGNDG
jgi:hypothetical protein